MITNEFPSFEGLGLLAAESDRLQQLISLESGCVLVVAPTGQGKSTLLYSCLDRIASAGRLAVTVEDPVEIIHPGITQILVDKENGRSMHALLANALRTDPDVLFASEIRDGPSARLMLEAARTGHLCLAALHSQDSTSVIPRLEDLGLSRRDIADAVNGVVSLRLVSRLCPERRVFNASLDESLKSKHRIGSPPMENLKFWGGVLGRGVSPSPLRREAAGSVRVR